MTPDEFMQMLEYAHNCYNLDCDHKICPDCEYNNKRSHINEYCIYKFVGRSFGFDTHVSSIDYKDSTITIDEYYKTFKQAAIDAVCGKYSHKSCNECPCYIKDSPFEDNCVIVIIERWKEV